MLVYVCDDSKADRMRLLHNIKTFSQENDCEFSIECFDSADKLLASFSEVSNRPDIIFLDIFMDGTNGMDAAEKLISLGMENGLVFTTSSEHHAIKAFSIGADGYLHKPYTHDDFVRAMKRFGKLIEDSRRYITVIHRREEKRVSLSSVIYVETARHNSVFHTTAGDITSSEPLGNLMNTLCDEYGMYPCGRSYAVNLDAVRQFSADGILTFTDGSFISVPVRLRRELAQKLAERHS